MRNHLSWQFCSALIAGLIFLPLLALVLMALGSPDASLRGVFGDHDALLTLLSTWEHLWQTVMPDYVRGSLQLMTGVAIVTLLLGIGSAWLVSQYDFTGVRFFNWALVLPFAMPTYITAYSYTGLLDVAGPLQSSLRSGLDLSYGQYWFPEIRSMGGAIFVMSLVLYPYVYLLARAAFLEQSRHLQDAAQLLGYSPAKVFFKVSLPIARPAIVAGVSLALMETLADYGAVHYFGVSTFTTGIFRTWYGLDSVSGAAQLSLVLLMFIILLVVIEKHSRRRAGYHHQKSAQPTTRKKLVGMHKLLAVLLCCLPLFMGFIIPAAQLLYWATQTYLQLLDPTFWRLVQNTVLLATVTSILALVLALLIVYSHRIVQNPVTRACKRIAALGYALPGTVIAIGTLTPLARLDNRIDAWFRSNYDYSTGLLISGTMAALVIAYLVRYLAVSLNAVDSGLAGIDRSMDQAARSLGAAPMRVLTRIHIPIVKSSLLTGVLLVFVEVIKELPATLILRPFNFNTLAVRAYEMASDERLADASLPAIAIVLSGLIPIILLTKTIRE